MSEDNLTERVHFYVILPLTGSSFSDSSDQHCSDFSGGIMAKNNGNRAPKITAPDLVLSIKLRRQVDRDFDALQKRLRAVINVQKSNKDVQKLSTPLKKLQSSIQKFAWGVR